QPNAFGIGEYGVQRMKRAVAVFVTIWSVTLVVGVVTNAQRGAVRQGSRQEAIRYYRALAPELAFRDATSILYSRLDDVLLYAGYAGLSADDLQRLDPAVLMDPDALGRGDVFDREMFAQRSAAAPMRSGDMLAARFFAPKIINVNDPPETRRLGWRKLIRLRARSGSTAAAHSVDAAIILLNFFTNPGEAPFDPHKK